MHKVMKCSNRQKGRIQIRGFSTTFRGFFGFLSCRYDYRHRSDRLHELIDWFRVFCACFWNVKYC